MKIMKKQLNALNDINAKAEALGARVVQEADINQRILQRLLEGREGMRLLSWEDADNQVIFNPVPITKNTSKK